METKKKIWLIMTCLFCFFQLQANGFGTPVDGKSNSAKAVSETIDPNDYFDHFEISPSPYFLGLTGRLEIRIHKKGDFMTTDDWWNGLFLYLVFQNTDGYSPGIDNFTSTYHEMGDEVIYQIDLHDGVEIIPGNYQLFGTLKYDSEPWESVVYYPIGSFLEIRTGINDYFERIEFSPSPYILDKDESLEIHLYKKEPFSNWSEKGLDLRFGFADEGFYPPGLPIPTQEFMPLSWTEDPYEVIFHVRFPEWAEITPGFYRIFISVFHLFEWGPPIVLPVKQSLEVREYEPIEETPVIQDVYSNSSNLWVTWSGNLNVSFTAVFERYEEAYKAKRAKVTLFRNDEIVSETISNLYENAYNQLRLHGSADLWCSSLMAGDYEIKIDFNPNTLYEGEIVCTLLEFEVPEIPELELTKLVHTGYGLYEASQIGNQDIFDMVIENWSYGYPSSPFQPFLLPSNTVIGSDGWGLYRYRLLEYESINIDNGTFTLKSINMDYVDKANPSVTYPIVPGDYILVIGTTNGYVKTTSIPVFNGKTEITPVVTGIEIVEPPYKTMYKAGDKLDLSGMVIRALYDITQGRLITDYTTLPADGSGLTLENTSVTISYTENGVTRSASYSINVTTADNWTVHQLNNSLDGIVIQPGSGNHIIRGTCVPPTFITTPPSEARFNIISVKSGYSGIIRFDGVKIDVSDVAVVYNNGSEKLNDISCMHIESDADVVLELVDSNTLQSAIYRSGIEVEDKTMLTIESESHGSLTINNGQSGFISVVTGSDTGGTLVIRGNAVVNSGIFVGAYNRKSNSKVIICGDAEVTASTTSEGGGAGIGGGAGPGSIGGTIVIEGNAVVNAYSYAGAGIGGGAGDYHDGGHGGIITLGGNARITAKSGGGTAIGGGRGGVNGHGGHSGIITIKDNAYVTAVGIGPYSGGIGGGPNHIMGGPQGGGGSYSCDIRITGGVINTSASNFGSNYTGTAIGSTFINSYVIISGGSIYNGKGSVTNPQIGLTSISNPSYKVKLIVQDENGNSLDNIRLLLDGYYEAETGKNLVWKEDAPLDFGDEFQPGIAYVWLREGERSVEILNTGYSFSPQSINVSRNSSQEFVITLTREITPSDFLTWQGTVDSDWNKEANWQDGQVPTETDIVVIPAENVSHFPVLTDDVEVKEIRFKPGAQLGGQSHLTGKAFVQYDLSERNRWHMLSMPLGEAYPGDFTFGGYPLTWVRTFKTTTTTTNDGSITKGAWVTARGSEVPFTFGDGFVLWLNEDNPVVEKGLKRLGGIHELPFFRNFIPGSEKYDLYKDVHQAHEYDSGTGESTFHNVELINGEYEIGDLKYSVPRSESAYSLLKGYFPKALDFGNNSEANGNVALVGNPYMAVLNFEELYAYMGNAYVIKPCYQVWTGAGYSAYTSNGSSGILVEETLNEFIAPLQAFLVEKPENQVSTTLNFNENMRNITAVSPRSSVVKGNKLDIVARNPVAGVLAFIAKREGGQDEFGNLDARKIINSISDIPEVYTLKPYKGGSIAVGANIIDNDELRIPIGLATSYTGNITLSFSGMDTYDAKLYLIDAETNREIELTGLASYDYVVNYTPKKVNGETAVCENRFFIRISKTVTGLTETLAEKVNVYEANGLIRVVSGASNPIKEVAVYNLQGVLMYKESAINAISHTVNRNWPAGAYIVKVFSEKNTDNVKLIIR